MKITEELWNKFGNEYDNRNDSSLEAISLRNYYHSILRKITKKETLNIYISNKKTTLKGDQQYEDFILSSEFLNKFNLTPGNEFIIDRTYLSERYFGGLGSFYTSVISTGTKIDIIEKNDLKIYPLMLFGDDLVISLGIEVKDNDEASKIYYKNKSKIGVLKIRDIYYTSNKAREVKEILKELSELSKSLPEPINKYEECIKVEFAYIDSAGIDTVKKFVKINDIQLDQFNESLPHEKIIDILNRNEPGLIILHGEPGCGKSSYIRYLIKECSKTFVIMSQDLLQNMNSFREFLLNVDEDKIIVIEDCENLVKSRENSGSSLVISDFLNITDGIYGDLYRTKFILTFNTDVQTIDQALLRKGRLKCKYKFNKLKGDRLKKLAEKLGISLNGKQVEEGLTLADLFNYEEDNGTAKKEPVKIGFNR